MNKENIDKSILRKFWDFLGSRNLSVVLFATAIMFVFILFIFAFLMPVMGVNKVAQIVPLQLLYIIFFINLTICMIKLLPVIIRNFNSSKKDMQRELDKSSSKFKIDLSSFDNPDFIKYLKKRFFKIVIHKSDEKEGNIKLYAVRNRFSPFGSLLFHLSFFLVLLGIITSFLFRFEGTAIMPENYIFKPNTAYQNISRGILGSLPETSFQLKNIIPTFWEDKMHFINLEANVLHDKGESKLKLSHATEISGANVNIIGFGYAPFYVLRDKSYKILDKNHVILTILTPKSEDFFQIQGYPHKIYVRLYPDYMIKNGKPFTKTMNAVNPAYSLRIFRNRFLVYEGTIKQGETADFDGLKLSFDNLSKWGNFRVVNDPGESVIWFGFFIMALGLFLKLGFYKKKIFIWQENKKIYLTGSFDYYNSLNEKWLQELALKFNRKKS
ncbi:MAG: cytochrome c biogenesis protein ResB [Spirochaetia bacterium]|nr:cytochrome c biogenesis protein ResB [Spirochaetia bacterium]